MTTYSDKLQHLEGLNGCWLCSLPGQWFSSQALKSAPSPNIDQEYPKYNDEEEEEGWGEKVSGFVG